MMGNGKIFNRLLQIYRAVDEINGHVEKVFRNQYTPL